MKRLLSVLLLVAAPAFAQENGWQEIQNGWGEIQTATGGGGVSPACLATQVPFLGTPVSLGLVCDAGLTYDAATGTLTVNGGVTSPTAVGAASAPQWTSKITFPLEAAAPTYGTVTQTFDNPYGTRKTQVVSQGFNADQATAGEPIWITSMESRFDPDALNSLSEWHLAWTLGAVGYRPISFSINRVDNKSSGYFQAGVIDFRDEAGLVLDSVNTTGKVRHMANGLYLLHDQNNVQFLAQAKATSGSVEIARVNAADEVALAPQGGVVSWTGSLHGSTSAASNNGVALGTGSTASGTASTALGNSAYSRLAGQVTNAYNAWSAAGQSQWSRVPMAVQFSTAADAEMLIGRSYRVTMQTQVVYSCRINVVVTDYSDRTKVVAFTGQWAATMTGAVGTALLNGVATEIALTEVYGNVATLTAFAKADTTNGAIGIWIRPPSGNTNTYIGTASLEWVEISYN